jgi:CRP-like cAMP-binding protein
MISPEVLRRYQFFAGFGNNQLAQLAMVSQELRVEAGHSFFRETDELRYLYFVESGEVAITLGVPDRNVEQDVRNHIVGGFVLEEVAVSTIGPGDLFGWSALIPPHDSTASAVAMAACKVFAVDCHELKPMFEQDCTFGYMMLLRVAKVVRQRLRDMHVRSLSFATA